MSLRERLRENEGKVSDDLYEQFGVHKNPFPASNQTSQNPHFSLDADKQAEHRLVTFFRDRRSQVVVVEGTQGVGKTNFLNHVDAEIRDVLEDREGFYVVRYLADPESSFEGTTRRLFQELGTDHFVRLRESLCQDYSPIDHARGHDMRTALYRLSESDEDEIVGLLMEWLLGHRLLKAHREALGVQFRLDTVESKTAALRDIVLVSGKAGVLRGIFLLLDELEKQDGVLGPRAVVRYLSAIRAVVDALSERLFLMIAITPDALIRYSAALPALHSRLQSRIKLEPLKDFADALELAEFYVDAARKRTPELARGVGSERFEQILSTAQIKECYQGLSRQAGRRGDTGVRQREFLHQLHMLAEEVLQG